MHYPGSYCSVGVCNCNNGWSQLGTYEEENQMTGFKLCDLTCLNFQRLDKSSFNLSIFLVSTYGFFGNVFT